MIETVETARKLDEHGRCCGRKPLVYSRPTHLFCARCDRAFDLRGNQITNWAWCEAVGGFRQNPKYKPLDVEE